MAIKKRTLTWSAALLVLAAALVFFNLPSPPRQDTAAEVFPPDLNRYASSAPLGFHPGEQLPDFSLTLTDGKEFVLGECRGKVTVINLWATWCTPCVNELPHFDRLQRNHPDDVRVLAIHSDLITDDVNAYLSGFDYQISFAVDAEGGVIASLGGSVMLPQTVVLNPRGEVTYNKAGSVTYEALEELVTAAREQQ